MSNDTESLLRGSIEAAALAHRLALIRIEAEHRLALYLSRSKPDRAAAGAAASPAQPEPSAAHATPTLAAHAPQVAQVPPASSGRIRACRRLTAQPAISEHLDPQAHRPEKTTESHAQ